MSKTYEGEKPYAFVSYAHKDADRVLPIISFLQSAGYRIWYDAGIEAGSEWPEYIASHLKRSACVLAFISESFVASQNCRRELTFGQELNIPMLNVYLEQVALSDGMRMQLGLNQCIYANNYRVKGDFISAICRASILLPCLGDRRESTDPRDAFQNAGTRTPISNDAPAATPAQKKESAGAFNTLAWVIELTHAWLGPIGMSLLTHRTSNVLILILAISALHTAISLVTRLFYNGMRKSMTVGQANDAADTWNTACVLSFFLSLVISGFYIHTTASIFLKILITIGLHIIPLFVCLGGVTPDLPKDENK